MWMKGKLINMTQEWDKEKNLSTWTKLMTSHKHWAGTLSTELRELMESKLI